MARHKVKPFTPAPRQKCGGKNRYTTRQEAELVAEQQMLLFASEGLRLYVYHCAYCGGWHLTSHRDPWRMLK